MNVYDLAIRVEETQEGAIIATSRRAPICRACLWPGTLLKKF